MTSAADPKPMSRTSAILYGIGLPLALVALVFLPAGRIDWIPGWIFIAVLVATFGLCTAAGTLESDDLPRTQPLPTRHREMGPDPARGHAPGHGRRIHSQRSTPA